MVGSFKLSGFFAFNNRFCGTVSLVLAMPTEAFCDVPKTYQGFILNYLISNLKKKQGPPKFKKHVQALVLSMKYVFRNLRRPYLFSKGLYVLS